MTESVYRESPVHVWFSLSYSSYLTIPRSALEAMPHEWQERFVALMQEAEDMGLETPGYTVQRRDEKGRFIKDEWANYRRPEINHLLPEELRHASEAKPYGYSSVIDVVDCDPSTFTRSCIEAFLVDLCNRIDMERADLLWWDYDDPEEKESAPKHLKGTSAVQFIMTSSIVIHTLEDLRGIFIDLFSCKAYTPGIVECVIKDHFKGRVTKFLNFTRSL